MPGAFFSEHSEPESTLVFTDSEDFFDQLTRDVQSARQSVCVQCMSFEADSVGFKLIELLGSKPTLERTLLIDDYSNYVVNDVFLPGPGGLMNTNNARTERKALPALLKQARDQGIRIGFTNPMGLLLRKYPARNHKKLVLIDDRISYVGGINFTEHNFKWQDLMVRHDHAALGCALRSSFDADLSGGTTKAEFAIQDGLSLFLHDGTTDREAFRKLLNLITSAKKVVAISPYISYPVLDAISGVSDNTVILPEQNNKPFLNLIHGLGRYRNIRFRHASGEMVHMKLLLIDDQTAIYGSTNFDTISYLFEKEIIIRNSDPGLVEQMKAVTQHLIS